MSPIVEFGERYWREPIQLDTILASPQIGQVDGEFRLLAEMLPTLCWLAGGDGSIFWYNRRWHDYCGTTIEAMRGWGWQAVHDPAELPRVLRRWRDALAEERPFEMIFPLRGADGSFRPFLTRVVPVRDATGGVVRWFGVNTEIGAQVRAEKALRASEAKYNVLTEAMPQMVWSALPTGDHDYFNKQWYAFTGVQPGSVDGEGWNEVFHPEDCERTRGLWRHSLATGDPYEIEYRLRHHSGEYRWTLGRARAVRDADGHITRWIGTCTDIDAAKRASEAGDLLNRELSHRIKNIFAVIGALIGLAGRRSPECRPSAKDLMARVTALGQAHGFARVHSEVSQSTTRASTLQGLLQQLLRPYTNQHHKRIEVGGADATLDDHGATPIALVVHELATNSAKYGAFSVEDGHVAIGVVRDNDALTLTWTETGGPSIERLPDHKGFGTELAVMSIDRQLGGKILWDWRATGLQVTLLLQASRLVRG